MWKRTKELLLRASVRPSVNADTFFFSSLLFPILGFLRVSPADAHRHRHRHRHARNTAQRSAAHSSQIEIVRSQIWCLFWKVVLFSFPKSHEDRTKLGSLERTSEKKKQSREETHSQERGEERFRFSLFWTFETRSFILLSVSGRSCEGIYIHTHAHIYMASQEEDKQSSPTITVSTCIFLFSFFHCHYLCNWCFLMWMNEFER